MNFVPSQHQREIMDKAMPENLASRSFQLGLSIHGVPCRFHFASSSLVEDMENFFPRSWRQDFLEEDPIDIYWMSPSEFLNKDVPLWGDVVSPDCHFVEDWVLQRDFACRWVDRRKVFLVAENQISDGIFNFLRYLLPMELLLGESVLFHSSCVVDEESGNAYVFFGPSGAGKTTISQLCKGVNVLGDDMNLLRLEKKKVVVESALVGQRYYSKENFAKSFPVKAAFWLTQSKEIKISPIKKGRLNKLLSSFSGFFWEQLPMSHYQQVFRLAQSFSKKMKINELEFNKTEEVWNHVRFFDQNL